MTASVTAGPRRQRVVLTPLALGVLCAGAVLVGLTSLTDVVWLLLLAGGCVGALVADRLLHPRLSALTFCYDGPLRCVAGASAEHVVHVHNPGRRATPVMRLTDFTPGWDEVSLAVPALPPGGVARVELTRRAAVRKDSSEHLLVLAARAPFGTHETRMHTTVRGHRLVVHPAPVAVRGVDAAGPVGARPTGRRQVHEWAGVRAFRTGDDVRDVHRRATARRGYPVVVERDRQDERRVAIVLCSHAHADDWEPLVGLAASAAGDALARRFRVALLAGTSMLTEPTRTTTLDWFSGLDNPPAPTDAMVRRLTHWAGGPVDVLIASPSQVPDSTWAALNRAVVSAGGRIGHLRLDDRLDGAA